MEISNQKSTPIKKWRIFVFIACAVVFLGLAILAIWAIWMFGAAELTAKCDNGLTVWRRNPGAASSYVYEVRDGTTIIKSNLRMKQLREYGCVFSGWGLGFSFLPTSCSTKLIISMESCLRIFLIERKCFRTKNILG